MAERRSNPPGFGDLVPPRPVSVTANGQELTIRGHPVRILAERAGRTPFFVYDRQTVAETVAEVRRHIPADVALRYAIKANPLPALLGVAAGHVDGFDVASAREMHAALNACGDPARVAFAGPGKDEAELRQAIAAGVLVEAESPTELSRIAAIAEHLSMPARIALRINPEVAPGGAAVRMSGATPFGMPAAVARAWLAAADGTALRYEGLHCFFGSQILDGAALAAMFRKTAEILLDVAGAGRVAPSHINLGGGLGIPYHQGERPVDLPSVGGGIEAAVRLLRGHWPDVRIGIELGRYLVGEAGIYVTRVLDRKVAAGRTFLVTDGGLHHVLAASGNFGQRIRRNFPVVVATRMSSPCDLVQTIVGRNCTPLDILAEEAPLPAAEPGDLIAMLNTGAYGFSASPKDFLSHEYPAEMLL